MANLVVRFSEIGWHSELFVTPRQRCHGGELEISMMELLAKKEEEILGKEEAGTIRTTRAPDICSMACHFGMLLGQRLAHK